ncbi:MAG: hypothetical protein M1426_04400 [Patescibacteria group bacterium]|nr:hypothetical protein [Patescibacteria group bacterium]
MDPNSAQNDGQNENPQPETLDVPENIQQQPSDLNQNPLINPPLDQNPPPDPLSQTPSVNVPQVQVQTPQPPAATDTPSVFTSQSPMPQDAMADSSEGKPRKPLFFLLLFFVLFILLIGFGGLTYAVAYEKIKLEKYPDFQKKVAAFVMELPFTPKTPKFLLARSAMAHQDITKQAFDISMAIDSADLASSLGL